MGGPTLTRAALAAGTMGMSEVPRQVMSATDVVVGTAKGDPGQGFKDAGKTYAAGDPTEPPALGTPPPTTDPNQPAYDAAKKTAQDDEARRLRSGGGRASTILTGDQTGTPLGGSRRTLGAA